MKYLASLVICFTLMGCGAFEPRDVRQVPMDKTPYAALYFSSPSGSRVHVYEIYARGNGVSITDYVEVPEPVFLVPGKTKVTFACPDAKVKSYGNKAVVYTPRPGTYYLYCNSQGKLAVARRAEA